MSQEELNNTTPDNISYDLYDNSVQYTIPKNLDEARQQYAEIPVVNKFVNQEIQSKFVATHQENRDIVSGYEVTGFLWQHSGEEFCLDLADYGVPNE